MNTRTNLFRRVYGFRFTLPTACFVCLVPLAAIADPHVATAPHGRVAEVSLTDLDLSTAEGIHSARARLVAVARVVCATPEAKRERPSQPILAGCIEHTVANALRQIGLLRQGNRIVRNSVIRGDNVSLAGLDISTPEGLRVTKERLRAAARRLCSELAHSGDLSYTPDFHACVDDSTREALGQVIAFSAVNRSHLAQGSPHEP